MYVRRGKEEYKQVISEEDFESLKFELRKKLEHIITFSLGIAKKMVLLDKFKPRNQSESISTTE